MLKTDLLLYGINHCMFTRLMRIIHIYGQMFQNVDVPLCCIHAKLGLFHFYIGSTMDVNQFLFDFKDNTIIVFPFDKKLLKIISYRLWNHPSVQVVFPSKERMHQLDTLVNEQQPVTTDIIGFMDDLSLHSEWNMDIFQLNSMCNQYPTNTMINNVLAYGEDGKYFFTGSIFLGVGMMGQMQQFASYHF